MSSSSRVRLQVLVDVLSRVWCQLSLDACAKVLPLLEDVLASTHDRYPFRIRFRILSDSIRIFFCIRFVSVPLPSQR